MVPDTYKNIESLCNFKNAIKKWKAENCPYRICKIFVKNIGFGEMFYILFLFVHILTFKFQKVLL